MARSPMQGYTLWSSETNWKLDQGWKNHIIWPVQIRCMYKIDAFLLVVHCQYRYDIMKSCWKKLPQDRPTFSELIARLSKSLISMAEYLPLES